MRRKYKLPAASLKKVEYNYFKMAIEVSDRQIPQFLFALVALLWGIHAWIARRCSSLLCVINASVLLRRMLNAK